MFEIPGLTERPRPRCRVWVPGGAPAVSPRFQLRVEFVNQRVGCLEDLLVSWHPARGRPGRMRRMQIYLTEYEIGVPVDFGRGHLVVPPQAQDFERVTS